MEEHCPRLFLALAPAALRALVFARQWRGCPGRGKRKREKKEKEYSPAEGRKRTENDLLGIELIWQHTGRPWIADKSSSFLTSQRREKGN